MTVSDIDHTESQQTGFSDEAGVGPEASDALGGEEWGVAMEMDPLTAEAPQKKRHTGALVLIVVVGLAMGSLFSMHTLTKVTAASGRNTDIERTIDGFLKSRTGGPRVDPNSGGTLLDQHKEVVDVLTRSYTEHQITQLHKNPFDTLSSAVVIESGGGDLAKAHRRDQMERAAGMLRLKSVIMGSRPLANINGRIVRLKQMIPVELSKAEGTIKLRVEKITSDSVTVVAEDPEIDLRVEKVIHLKRKR